MLYEKILTIISNYIDLDSDQDFNLTESIVFVKMILELEGTFDFQFDDHKLSAYKFSTITSFVEYIVDKISNK